MPPSLMTPFLPATGRTTTEDLGAALRDAPALLGEPAALEVRTVAVLADGRWFNFHTVSRAGRSRPCTPSRKRMIEATTSMSPSAISR